MASTSQLRQGLSQRQLNMIAIGGVIGAGLFVGSGVVIKDTGPAAFLTYALCGLLIILVMRMLGEMAAANPSTGSFADYAAKALGGWAGFSVGWLYWYFWVIVVGFEAVAGGKGPQLLVPGAAVAAVAVPDGADDRDQPVLGVVLRRIRILVRRNQSRDHRDLSRRRYGCSSSGSCRAITTDLSNLSSHGGFFPNGVGAVFAAIVVVIFSMVGAEIVTIAAAESSRPGARSPASDEIGGRAHRDLLRRFGLPARRDPAVEFRGARRLALRRRAQAHGTRRRGSGDECGGAHRGAVLPELGPLHRVAHAVRARRPTRGAGAAGQSSAGAGFRYIAILCSSAVGFGCVIMAWVAPDTVFLFLLNSSGAIILFVYWLIALSQIILRRRTPAEKLRVKMWFFPVLSILTLVGITAVLVQMAFDRSRAQSAVAQPAVLGGGDRAVLWSRGPAAASASGAKSPSEG